MTGKNFFLHIMIACITIFFLHSTCAAANREGARLYTAYNLWYEKPQSMWAINYKKGSIIPAGTEVANVALVRKRRSLVISFTTASDGGKFLVHFNRKFHLGKTVQDYKNMMFTEKNFRQLTKGFSKNEIKAIKNGSLVSGMSKPAVIAAYGYPPEHKTPSIDNNIWYYWTNRFRSKAVNFDKKGETYIH